MVRGGVVLGQHYVLGVSAYYHDSAAALIVDGKIWSAAQEERFTRIKHDPAFPASAIRYCLSEAGISLAQVDLIVFYDKPLLKFERLLETYLGRAPRGFSSFVNAMPVWMKEKLYLTSILKKEFKALGKHVPKIIYTEHHQAHAASAFFPSPFGSAAVLCLDGVGEWATTSVWMGQGNSLKPLWQINFPHSLGLLYSAFTYYTGFKVNSGEYKLMGLAPYGEPKYVDMIRKHLVECSEDGTFRLQRSYFDFETGLRMVSRKFCDLFGGPAREPESPITQKEMDLARSIQVVTEDIVLALSRTVYRETGVDALCMAGGVALNCVANGRLKREGPFKNLWIQPAAGDAGGAIGAALVGWHTYLGNERSVDAEDGMSGAFLGPAYESADALRRLKCMGATVESLAAEDVLARVSLTWPGKTGPG